MRTICSLASARCSASTRPPVRSPVQVRRRRLPMRSYAQLQSTGVAPLPSDTAAEDRAGAGAHVIKADRKLRVLQVIGTMHIGGAENVVVELCRGLDRSRFDVALCCTRETGVLSDQLRAEGVDVILGAPPTRRLRHFTSFY